jgi:hypothetical protein
MLFLIFLSLHLNIFSQNVEYRTKDGSYSLILKGDTSFKYTFRNGFHFIVSNGNYKKINRNIVLNSKLDSSFIIPIEINESQNKDDNKLTFEIVNLMPLDSTRGYVILLDGEEVGSSSNKSIKIAFVKKFSTIQLILISKKRYHIPFEIRDSIKSNVCKIQNLNSNIFKIKWDIDFKMFYYIPIKNDTLIYKKKKIIWPKEDVILYKIPPDSLNMRES